MAKIDELKDILSRVDTATNNIADDIRRLSAQIGTGLTDAQVADLQALMEASAVKLEGVAAVTPEPPTT